MLAHTLGATGRAETLGATYVAATTVAGTTVTAGGTNNAKGSWAALGTPTFQYEGVNVCVAQTAASSKLFDIGINDGSGNWHVIAEDLHFPGAKYADQIFVYDLPLRVKSGQQVGLRCQASTASHVLQASLTGFSSGPLGRPGYSRMVRLSANANSRGTAVDPGGTALTKGAWTQIVASTSHAYDGLFAIVGMNGDTSRTATATALLDIGIGASSNESPIVENLFLRWTTTGDGPFTIVGRLPVPVSLASRVVARAACSDATAGDRTLDVNLYGLIP